MHMDIYTLHVHVDGDASEFVYGDASEFVYGDASEFVHI
jgi:hypothetical protein